MTSGKQIKGKILALDVGDARIGLAVSDPTGFLASPLGIIKRDPDSVSKILKELELHSIEALLVGLPLNMDGSEGFQAKKTLRFAEKLQEALPEGFPLIMEDERQSTETAREMRLERGTRKKKRQGRIDAEAAAIFLQAYLDRKD